MYRILYVDDEPELLEVGKIFLEAEGGIQVDTRTSAEQGVSLLASSHYDAVISDYQMPGMNGIVFLKKVRASQNTIPFILFTGRGREEIVIQALNEGADFYLQKGGDPEAQFTELLNKVRYAINSRQAEVALRESEEKYRRIVETSTEGIWSVDAGFNTVFVNRKMADLLGCSTEEMQGKNITDFMDPADLADNQLKMENRRNGSNDFYERKFRRRDGRYRWFWVSSTSLKGPEGGFAGSFAMLTDITDRKQAEDELKRKNEELGAAYEQLTASEEELRENLDELAASQRDLKASEEKYRRIVETANEGIWVMDSELVTVYANQRLAGMLGYTIDEMIGKKIMEFMDPGELEDNAKKLENRRKGINEYYERKFQRKDGGTGWFGISVTALKNPDGSFGGSFAMLTDITDRKQAQDELKVKNEELGAAYEQLTASEEELRENLEELTASQQKLRASEEKYRDLYENAILGIFRTTPEGRYLEMNPAFAHIMGFSSPEEMITSIHDIGAQLYARPEDRDTFKEKLTTDGEVQNFETEVLHKDGTAIWIAINARVARGPDGRILWYNGTIENITSRKKAELELSRKNEELQASYEEITATEEELRQNIEELSKKEQDLREKSAELGNRNELISTLLDTIPIGIFMVEAPSGKPVLANQEAARLLGRGVLPDATETNLSEVYEAYRLGTIEKYPPHEMPIIRGLRGESSYIDDMVVVRPDGTRVWLEIFGNPVRDTEGKIVASLVSFLDISDRKRAEAALRQANHKLNLLSSITRHDITNQVTSLKSYLTLIRKKQPESPAAEYLVKAMEIVQRIDTLTRFTKEYENIGISAPVWQDLRDLVDTVSGQIRSDTISIQNEIPPGVEIFADPLAVKVFYNLIDNAMNYGSTLSTIKFSGEQNNGNYTIICEDNGQGIPSEEKEMIFERGYGKNTGLGLALCQEILDITGISIRETGIPGWGARFEMTVPRGQFRSVL